MKTENDLENRFAYHKSDWKTAQEHNEMRSRCAHLAEFIEGNVPWGREQALALTKVEEAMFWANAGIARIDKSGERL